eukprot:947798-Amphidinium_carterae.1
MSISGAVCAHESRPQAHFCPQRVAANMAPTGREATWLATLWSARSTPTNTAEQDRQLKRNTADFKPQHPTTTSPRV